MPEIKIKNSSLLAGRSIKTKIIISYSIILFFMGIFAGIYYYNIIHLNKSYDTLVQNTQNAIAVRKYIDEQMYERLWDIVAGNSDLKEDRPSLFVSEIENRLTDIEKTLVFPQSRSEISALFRTLDTLHIYVERLESQILSGTAVYETEETFYEIRHVTKLIDELIDDLIIAELDAAAGLNAELQFRKKAFLIVMSVFFAIAAMSLLMLYRAQLKDIQIPLIELEKYASQISNGNFHTEASLPMIDEFVSLGRSLSSMSYKLEILMREKVEVQKNINKSEMQVLQAQIAPHFLYNTLDTIIWLSEEGRSKEAIAITRAFSKFFRISLSKGRDWIPVTEELEHAKSYLRIQKIRYRDILQYEVIEDVALKDEKMLKLLLQPIIENALYHGLKKRRSGRRGFIRVLSQKEKDHIYFEVTDNGVGINPQALEKLIESFSKKPDEMLESGYGLYNVNRRLSIYYGEDYRLSIESEENLGTKVYFRIPFCGRLQI